MTTSTHLPVCVYCSTARPADRTGCPTCGRPWIDVRIGEGSPVAMGTAVARAASDSQGAPDLDDGPADRTTEAKGQPAKAAVVAVATSAVVDGDDETTAEITAPAEAKTATSTTGTPPDTEPEDQEDSDADPDDVAEPQSEAEPQGDAATPIAAASVDDAEDADPPPPAANRDLVAAAAPPPPPPAAAPPPPPPPADTGHSRRRWLLPAALAFATVLVFGAITFVALNRGNGTGPSEAAATTTRLSTTTTALATTEPAATAAPATAAPETTAPEPTTTTTTQPTTTTAVPPADSFEPVGEPIPTADLTLRAGAIGPIAFGTATDEAVGRLVASLGTADETGIAGTDLGLCADGDGMWVRFGDFTAIVFGDAATGELVGFQHEAADPDVVEPDLLTPSGLKIGDTLATLEQTYPNYKIVYQNVDGGLLFRLIDDAELLLWGPITSTESGGKVMGISSPPDCPVP